MPLRYNSLHAHCAREHSLHLRTFHARLPRHLAEGGPGGGGHCSCRPGVGGLRLQYQLLHFVGLSNHQLGRPHPASAQRYGRLSAHRRGSHARVLQPEHRGAQHPHRFCHRSAGPEHRREDPVHRLGPPDLFRHHRIHRRHPRCERVHRGGSEQVHQPADRWLRGEPAHRGGGGGCLLSHPLERRLPERPSPLRLQPAALRRRFRTAASGLRLPSQVGHLPHPHCREPAQVEGGHHLRRGHRAGAYDDVPLLRLEPRGRGHFLLQLRRLERYVAREHLRGGRRQRPAVRHAGPGHGQRPAVSGGGAAPVAQGHGGSLRQGRPRRGPEGDRRALPVRCGLPRRALLRLLRRGAGAAVLPALLSAHRGQFPHGHRRARHGAAVHLGGHGPSRPIRPLPFPLGEPRRVPAASDTARVLLRHHVPREVPDLLLPAHHVRPGVLGVGPVLLDALAARRAQVRLAVRRVAVHGARGWLPSPAARAVTSGLPAVLAHLHHRAPAGHPPGYRGVRLPGGPLRFGGRGHHGLQLRALRLADRFRRELQPDGERHDQARHERRSPGPGVLHLLPTAALHDRRLPVFAAGAF